jgi:hypothetical protein
MDEGAKVEQAGMHGERLKQVTEQFRHWRETRIRGEHIPPHLWAAAVGMAREHGLHRVVCELGVDRDRLKRRLARNGGAAQPGKGSMRFVELMVAPAPGAPMLRECTVELENGRGAKMRVELNGNGIAALAGLCSAFWGAA